MATRKVARKKPASASSQAPVRAPETKIDNDANTDAIQSKDASGGKVQNTAKVVSLQVSVGDYDKRSFEKFVEDLQKALKKVPYGEKGHHVSVMGGYYVLDGKVCRPEDYDPKTKNFKKGTTPPEWAGGPKKSKVVSIQNEMERDRDTLSSDAYDRKYKIGKYAPKRETSTAHDERMRRQRAEVARQKQAAEEAELEEFDWDESDVENTDKLQAAADKSASAAINRLKSTKKRVVKKAAPKPAAKKVVRRTKK